MDKGPCIHCGDMTDEQLDGEFVCTECAIQLETEEDNEET